MSGRLDGRRALVTGGASGIGLATAGRLRQDGAAVVLLDRDAHALDEATGRLGVPGITCDVAASAEVEAAVTVASEHLGGACDVLVNAAGIYRISPLMEMQVAEWDEVIGINLRGCFLVAGAVARALAGADRGGAIVNLASTAALEADLDEPAAHYNASKAGIVALTKQMAVEWAPHGIRVNAVCPGVIDTPMMRLMDDPERGREYVEAAIPLRRLGTPADVAALIAFLASDDASYITGAAVTIDGGATAL